MGFVGLLIFDIEKSILLLSLARCNIETRNGVKMHHECIFCNHELVSCFFFLKGEYFYEKMHEKDPDGEYRSCNHLFRRGG